MGLIYANRKQRGYWPSPGEWLVHDPDYRYVGSVGLSNAINYCSANSSSSFILVRNGFIVAEEYFGGATSATVIDGKSFAKSLIGAAIGVALNRGDLSSINQSVSGILGPWPNNPNYADLKIRHLLDHTSGVNVDAAAMMATNDWTAYILASTPAFAPGTNFLYNSGNMLASAVIKAVTGLSVSEYLNTYLFTPIGITSYTWIGDKAGNTWGDGGFSATPRDFLRIGLLFQSDGLWNGERILPVHYMDLATAPALLPAANKTAVSVWNTTPEPLVVDKPFDYGWDFICRSITGVPTETFFAFGGNGTIVGMLPKSTMDAVFIRTGSVVGIHSDETFMETLAGHVVSSLGVQTTQI